MNDPVNIASHISFLIVREDKHPGIVAKLIEFAKSFDHTIDSWAHPIVITKIGDRWLGYHQIIKECIMFNAFNPKTCSPREVVEAMKALAAWARLQHGGGFTAAPMDSKTFTPEVMQRLGFRRTGMELWELEA